MKKLVSKLIFYIFIGFSLFAAEFQVRLLPAYSYIQGVSDASAGGILSLDFAPVTFRANDKILLSLQGSFNNLFEDGIKSEQLLDYNLSLAYSMRITDRFYLMPEGFGGLWTITENTTEGLPQQNGYFYGGRLSANIHIMPEMDISLFAGYKGLSLAHFFHIQFMQDLVFHTILQKVQDTLQILKLQMPIYSHCSLFFMLIIVIILLEQFQFKTTKKPQLMM